MSRYRIDAAVVDTDKATASYEQGRRHDGHNWISLATGSQWEGEKLYRSRRGRYYVVHFSAYQGRTEYAEWISNEEAARWLLVNQEDKELPEDLREAAESITE